MDILKTGLDTYKCSDLKVNLSDSIWNTGKTGDIYSYLVVWFEDLV